MRRHRRSLVALVLVAVIGGATAWWAGDPGAVAVARMEEPAWRAALDEARGGPEATALRAAALDQIGSGGSDHARAEGVRLLGYVGREADVPLLAELIEAPSADVRFAAVAALGGIGGDAAVGLLTRVVEADDPQLEAHAWYALGAAAHPDALALMDARLREREDLSMVAAALARTGSPEAARALARAFGEASSNDAWALATGLASFSSDVPEARDALLAGARSGSAHLRAAALGGLAQSGDPALFDLVDRALADGDPIRLAEIAAALGGARDPRALPVLLHLVDQGPSGAASSALYAIAQLATPEADAALLDVIAHGRADLASQAVWSMRDPTGPDAVAVLIAAVDERPMMVRQAAVARLMQGPWREGEVPDAVLELAREQIAAGGAYGAMPMEAFGLLLDHGIEVDAALVREVIDAAPSWHRVTAVSALRGHDAPWIPDLLLGLVADPDPSVAQAAVDVILERPELKPRLERALLDQLEDGGSWAACQGLARLGTPRALGELYDRIATGTSNEASEAAAALSSWGDRDALDQLVGLLDDVDDPSVRQTLYSTLLYRTDLDAAALADQALDEADPSIRAMAATALAQSGSADARARLLDLVEDEDLSVRSSALYAMAQVGGPEAEAVARGLVDDPELGTSAIGTLAQIGTRSAREAIADVALTSEREDLRAQAIYSLSSSPGRETEQILVRALDDDSASVRMAAISSLQSSGSRRASEALVPLLDADPEDAEGWGEAMQAAYALQALGGPAYQAHEERVTEVLSGGWGGGAAMYGGLGYLAEPEVWVEEPVELEEEWLDEEWEEELDDEAYEPNAWADTGR